MSRKSYLCIGACIFAMVICSSRCHASHPNHVSSAEVNWNPKSGNFEVALCVWPSDLEKALGRDQSKVIDLDKIKVGDLDHMMQSYIEKRFLIRRSDTKKSEVNRPIGEQENSKPGIRWVGHERDHKAAWLYFEVAGDKQGAQWTIENRVFFELNDDQLNQVQMTTGKTTDILICQPGNAAQHSIETSSHVALKR